MTTLIGTNPDQIPVNSMLGGMAYQDPDSINVKDFNSSGTANIASLVSPTASVTTLTNTTANITTANITNVSYTGTLTGGTGVINIGSNQIYKDASGNVSLGGTGALKLNEGTTAQRPASPQEGMIRKNSTLGVIEGYSGGGYVSLEAGRLIGISEFRTTGVDSTFNVNAKTNYMVVEMVGGGGGGGGYTGSFTNNTVGLGYSGTPGCGVRFLIKNSDMASTFYYRIGAGGAGSSTAAGSGGSSTLLSKEPTSGTMTNYVVAEGGKGGFAGSIAAPPALLQPVLFPSLNCFGTASNWVILESSAGYTGESAYSLTSELPALRTRTQLDSFNQVANRMNCFYIHLYGHHGSGGGGREGKQTSGGVFTSILNATGGYPGMIRIYEYS